ncbi:MAG: alpha-L-fucosidase, partial [Pirellulaceae bacterium]
MQTRHHITLILSTVLFVLGTGDRVRGQRNAWYWDTVVNLHIDNHSLLIGQEKSAKELAAMYQDIPVDMIQVSAYGSRGNTITYRSDVLEHLEQQPKQGDWDTLAVWGAAVRRLGKRFHIYINTRGMSVHESHPEYMQQNAQGEGQGRGEGLYDACPRPAPDGDGYLEEFLLPLLREIVTKYEPGGIWVDGDHARTRTCYCKNCREAWRRKTGEAEPPTDPMNPDWPAWLALEQQRYDAYRRRMAEVIHNTDPNTMYTSNHSWRKTYGTRFEKIDPRSAPEWVDSYSADLSHGISIRQTRLAAMLLSPEEQTPYDIMHLVNRDHKISLGRVLQEGGITFSSGGAWFLWVGGGTALEPGARARARLCAEFAQARQDALRRTLSRNAVAVLSSEASWLEERVGGEEGYYDFIAANHAALALQDAGYGVDLVNEHILRRRLDEYRVLVIPNQRKVESKTLDALTRFVHQGGRVLVTGRGLAAHDTDALLGLRRTREFGESSLLNIHDTQTRLADFMKVEPVDADVLVQNDKSHPLVLAHTSGQGQMAYFAGTEIPYPDYDGLVPFLMQELGIGPMVSVHGPSPHPHLVFAFRKTE